MAIGALLVAVAGGGYAVTTQRMTGPRWTRLLPEARAKAQQLIAAARAAGLDVMFWDGWRSPEESAANAAAGTSKLADPYNSHHVWGAAVDIVFRNAAGLPVWPTDTDPRWRQLAEIGQRLGWLSGGLAWGWDWGHFQLRSVSMADLRARWGTDYLAFLRSAGVAVA